MYLMFPKNQNAVKCASYFTLYTFLYPLSKFHVIGIELSLCKFFHVSMAKVADGNCLYYICSKNYTQTIKTKNKSMKKDAKDSI